jgi:hypothetical protein
MTWLELLHNSSQAFRSYFEGSAQLFAFSYGMTALGDLRVLLT